ncbi:MAG: hypothetical protein JRG96_20150 [Deltaproteobacteria bacterium]|nr:hypothetical protein [Deltaproteobacteria bacterium]MBW2417782.1 hypothetical protein [Deltaproteobacteria bacterium]
MDGYATLLGALLFALVFVFVGRLRFLDRVGGERWLDLAAGVALAYVFVDIFPHLAREQVVLHAAAEVGFTGFLEHHAYLVALFGFAVFLGANLRSEELESAQPGELPPRIARAGVAVVVLTVSAYVGLLGYMLEEQPDHRAEPVAIFALAMAIHMLGVAHSLRGRQPGLYDRVHRYLFAAAALVGWGIGVLVDVPDTTYALWFSFLAGSIIAVTVTCELRRITSNTRFGFFFVGTSAFAAVLLLLEYAIKLE